MALFLVPALVGVGIGSTIDAEKFAHKLRSDVVKNMDDRDPGARIGRTMKRSMLVLLGTSHFVQHTLGKTAPVFERLTGIDKQINKKPYYRAAGFILGSMGIGAAALATAPVLAAGLTTAAAAGIAMPYFGYTYDHFAKQTEGTGFFQKALTGIRQYTTIGMTPQQNQQEPVVAPLQEIVQPVVQAPAQVNLTQEQMVQIANMVAVQLMQQQAAVQPPQP